MGAPHKPKETIPKVTLPVKKVNDFKTLNAFGLLLTTQKSLDEFTQKSGPLATGGANEYQHHYSSLVYNIKVGNESLDISIPMTLYNYPQKVSGGSIGFELIDVAAIVEATAEVSTARAADFQDTEFHKFIMSKFPNAELNITHYQQVHKHPGRMSSFSGTDLDNKPGNPGICFPFAKCDEPTASFGSIVCHIGGKTELVHTEYRQVLGDIETGNEITYLHGRSITYVKGNVQPLGQIESLFTKKQRGTPSYKVLNGVEADGINDLINEIIIAFENTDYEPSTDFIFPENVTKEVVSQGGYHHSRWNGAPKKETTTTEKNKYGQKAGKQKSLLDAIEKADENDGTVTQELINELNEMTDPEKKTDYENMVDGLEIPVIDEEEMTAAETSDMADMLREELEMYGIEKKALTLSTDKQIFKWAVALNLIEMAA